MPTLERVQICGTACAGLSGVAIVSLACSTAFAQEPSGRIEEVIVTAEFREADVQDTPIAITAINAQMLEARGQTNLVEVSAQAPNVQLSPAGQDMGSAMLAHIRGVGQLDFNYAMEPGVGIYVDDVYYPNMTGSMIDLIDIERVEILRGPQGTLAGRNSIGGAIKLYSVQPTRGPGTGRVELTVGDYDRVGIRGSVDMTFIEDKLFARLAGVSRTRDGYVTRLDYRCVNPESPIPAYSAGDLVGCELGTLGGESFTGGRMSLLWTPTDNLELTFIGDMINTNGESGAQVLFRVNEPTQLTNGFGQGTFFDADGDFATTDDRVYLSNEFVTHGPYRPADARINDPYVTYSTFLDPNPRLPTRPFSPVAVDPRSEFDQQGLSVQLNWDISERLGLTWISAMREYRDLWTQDTDGTPINQQMLTQVLRHEHYTHEGRLSGAAFNGRLNYTLGGFYVDQNVATLEANVNLYYAQLNFIHGPDLTPSDSSALFGHASYSLTDDLTLSLGLRASEDNKTYTFRRRNPDGTLPPACVANPPGLLTNPPNCALAGLFNVSESFESDRTDYRVALDYNLGGDVMVYGQVATGYKVGGINPRPFIIPQINVFAEEELETIEVGFKSLFGGGRVRLNGAYFTNDYTDIQLQLLQCQPVPELPCLQPDNVGDADSEGFELELEYRPIEALTIDASASWMDFEYTRVNPATFVTPDMVTPWTPETTWSLGVQYEWPLPTGGSFSARVDASFQDDVYADAINSPNNLIPSYTLTNARLTWRSSDQTWQAAFEVSNLTDEVYYRNVFEQFQGSSGIVSVGIAPPRMYAFRLARDFDL